MKFWILSVFSLCLLTGLGCSAKHLTGKRIDLYLPPGPPCNAAVTLHDCDTRLEPPRCRKISAKYAKGCEQIQLGH